MHWPPQTDIDTWVAKIKETEKIEDVNLRIYQGTDNSGELKEQISGDLKADILSELYINNEQKIRDKNERILFLENEIARLSVEKEGIPFKDVSAELKTLYDKLQFVGYAERIQNNFEIIDTIPVFSLKWEKTMRAKDKMAANDKIAALLKLRLKLDTLLVE